MESRSFPGTGRGARGKQTVQVGACGQPNHPCQQHQPCQEFSYRTAKGWKKQEGLVELRRRHAEDGKRMLVHLNRTAHHAMMILQSQN